MLIDSGAQLVIVMDGDTIVGKYDGLPIQLPNRFDVQQINDKQEFRDIDVEEWWNAK